MNEPFDVQSQLDAELDRGERIAWQAQARPAYFRGQAILPAIFGMAWFGVVITMIFAGSHGRNSRPASFFPIIPFILVGIIFIATPLLRLFNTRRTYYLITNQRALIVTLGSTKKVLSYYPEKLQSLERRERADGRGDIVIERTAGGAWGAYQNSRYLQEVGFMNIPDVKNIESMLRDLARKGTNGKS